MRHYMFIMRTFALLPYTKKGKTMRFQLLSLVSMYTCIVYFYFGFTIIKNFLENVLILMTKNEDITLRDFLDKFMGLPLKLCIFIIPLFWIDMYGIINYWHQWDSFQGKYESCTGKELTFQNATTRIRLLITIPIMLISLNIFLVCKRMHWKCKPISALNYIYIYVAISLITGYYHANSYMFQVTARDINQRILKVLVKSKSSTITFRDHVELWCHLSQLIKDFGNAHSSIYCSTALIMYIACAMSVFMFLVCFLVAVDKSSNMLYPILFTNAIVLMFCEGAYMILKEMGSDLQWKILNINVSGLNESMKHEVQDFIEIIQLSRTSMNFGGFCEINRNLYGKFILGIAFNVVILIQFQLIPTSS
ncbi:gustatory and odorant receptor 24-like [Adelges cooleyi]|uniref:gustatory and odorant receptor 24-like n=1 Tax=Adelges cooleyi TaxID=133065 RepID=UPI0021806602|nr:gustatory and odorant receptor 24-like [Adelges cooleyi]